MATDGVEIIDGDTAHDTYWGIMDLYDEGASIETIRIQIPFPQPDYYDDFDYEIYTTAYALAFWEIGGITPDIIQEVKYVIEKEACVKVWTEECHETEGKARQKELDKLWDKINSPNPKIRERKKYKKIEHFIFEVNDVLTFQLANNHFYATIILDISQYRGECSYKFGKIIFEDTIKPTIQDIEKSKIIGSKIPSGSGMDMTKILSMDFNEIQKQGGIDEILKREAEKTGSYQIGMSMTGIEHEDLIKISNKFSKIGTLKFKEISKQVGSMSAASNFEDLTVDFVDLDNYLNVFKNETFEIKELLEK
ncbi:hypothetical protein [Aureibacter tunicatorum]|uniref:Uncharacterized protein n=1 Tax=Aureibacter tunicatorum TaxID=866807 RepID=A0AAE3XQ62_9BACT|nr:hypothetical protein [Aureibacter tunicatorum]MDR6241097.1 hypothetical protein [Aureibacter tunicatorum]BDD03875.1 hypothetical protein AUTU_13580 [Aureibacter tunicatorum]